MDRLTRVHWMDTQEVDFFMGAFTLAAEDHMRENGDGRVWIPPFHAIYSWANSDFTRRAKNSLETVNIDNSEFSRDKYSKTYIQTGVVNQPGHWTFTSVLLREGDPTYRASTCTAMDTYKKCASLADCDESKLQTLCRGAMYSLQSTEPSRLDVPLVLPVHSQQGDGSSCGAMSLAYMCLTAMGVMDPHATDPKDPKAPWNITVATGAALYKWLGDVLESVDVGSDCEAVRKAGASGDWMPLPPYTCDRVVWEGRAPEDVCVTVPLVTPFLGHAKLAAGGEYAYKHMRTLKPGTHTTPRPGTYVTRDLVDEVFRRGREAAGLEELVVPTPPSCEFGCGRLTSIPLGTSVSAATYCGDSGGVSDCRPRGARRWGSVPTPRGADIGGIVGVGDANGDDENEEVKDDVGKAPAEVAVGGVGEAKGDEDVEDKGAVQKTLAEGAVEGVGGAKGGKTGCTAAADTGEPHSKRRKTGGKYSYKFGFWTVSFLCSILCKAPLTCIL
jgi:hypothetical protein